MKIATSGHKPNRALGILGPGSAETLCATYFAVSLTIVSSVFILEYIYGFRPCRLCLLERYPYFTMIIISCIVRALLIAPRINPETAKTILLLVNLPTLLFGSIVSLFHTFIVIGIMQYNCSGQVRFSDGNLPVSHYRSMLENIEPQPSCNASPFSILSIDLSFYSFSITFALLLFTALATYINFWRPKSRAVKNNFRINKIAP